MTTVNPTKDTLQKQYSTRFSASEQYRKKVWQVLCKDFFQKYVTGDSAIVDLGCGWGEFISHINAKHKYAIDLNPEAKNLLPDDVNFINQSSTEAWPIDRNSLDVIFTSNFLEHLADKTAVEKTIEQARLYLKPSGKLICMGPNIKYLAGEYWEYWDHHVPITDSSLAELLQLCDFNILEQHSKFLPYSMSQGKEPPLCLVKAYLKLPFAWKFFGKQFLLISSPKP